MRERDLYEPARGWATKHWDWFASGVDRGLKHGRIDVVGMRDVGGRLSGGAEVTAIEVKRGTQPFMSSVGQASGYSIYADRVYLADYRPNGFKPDELAIASRLGVGLIQISGEKRFRFTERITAPVREPIGGLRLEVVEKLHHSKCTICGSFFERGTARSFRANVVAADPPGPAAVIEADEQDKGLMYWLQERAARSPSDTDTIYHRRYVCPDCVGALLSQVIFTLDSEAVDILAEREAT